MFLVHMYYIVFSRWGCGSTRGRRRGGEGEGGGGGEGGGRERGIHFIDTVNK